MRRVVQVLWGGCLLLRRADLMSPKVLVGAFVRRGVEGVSLRESVASGHVQKVSFRPL